VLAENVANADTPGYMPKDIAGGDFARAMAAQHHGVQSQTRIVRTNPHHMAPPQPTRDWRTETAPDSETTLDGNGVVLEEQMTKVAESRMNYEAALGLYQKTLSLIRIAIKAPGR
jgi:flagellar basal-body rod protein FlgB